MNKKELVSLMIGLMLGCVLCRALTLTDSKTLIVQLVTNLCTFTMIAIYLKSNDRLK